MAVELRPHHLLCILTYVGKGYSAGFVRNYDRVVARINAGEAIDVVSGPDAICAPLIAAEDDPHCRRAGAADRDRRAADDLTGLLGRPIRPGARVVLDAMTVSALRRDFANGHQRRACLGCEWQELCSAVAATGFRETALSPSPPPVSRRSGRRSPGRPRRRS